MRTADGSRADSCAVCSVAERVWKTPSPHSCSCFSNPFCWAAQRGWCTTCCGRCACTGQGSRRCWTACTACCWAWGCCALPCGGGRESCGFLCCWDCWAVQSCIFPDARRSSAPSGRSGRKPWRICAVCCGFPWMLWKNWGKKSGHTEKISFILRRNAIQ